MWRTEHPDVALQQVPADMVMASGSGLDPHSSLDNANFQLERVAAKWADDLHRDPVELRKEIQHLLDENASAPWGGLIGEKFVNVLELNLELRKALRGPPSVRRGLARGRSPSERDRAGRTPLHPVVFSRTGLARSGPKA